MVVRRQNTYFYLPGFMNVAANMLAVITFLITAKNQVCSFGSLAVGSFLLSSGSLPWPWSAGLWDGSQRLQKAALVPRCFNESLTIAFPSCILTSKRCKYMCLEQGGSRLVVIVYSSLPCG